MIVKFNIDFDNGFYKIECSTLLFSRRKKFDKNEDYEKQVIEYFKREIRHFFSQLSNKRIEMVFDLRKGKKQDALYCQFKDPKLLMGLILKVHRLASKKSIKELSEELGYTSSNGYHIYERGQVNIGINQFYKFMKVINPRIVPTICLDK